LASFLAREGQHLLPFVRSVEHTRLAIDELIEVLGRATVEAVLTLSAEGVAGKSAKPVARAAVPGDVIQWR